MKTFILCAGILFIVQFTIWISKHILHKKTDEYPEGPRSIGGLGDLLTLRRLQTRPERELMSIAHTWRHICLLWAGKLPILIVNKPKAIEELLDDRSAISASRPLLNGFRIRIWSWRVALIPAGDKQRYLRKLYHKILNPQKSIEFRKYQDYESVKTLFNLLSQPESSYEEIGRYSMSTMLSMVYGVRLEQIEHPITTELMHLWEVIMKYLQPGSLLIDYIPILDKLPLCLQPGYRYAIKMRRREMQLQNAVFGLLKDAIRHGHSFDCFGKYLIEIQDKDNLDDLATTNILAMLIGGGVHIPKAVLLSFFKLMALNPEVVRKAHFELNSVVGSDRLPSWEDHASLSYIKNLIKEVHRCSGIAALGFPHSTTEDDYYLGRFIPKGTCVIPNMTALHQDPEKYPNPEIFEPDRFKNDLSNSNISTTQSDFGHRDHFNYGFGRRICPGVHFSEQSLFIVISRILWAFDIHEKPGHLLNMNSKIDSVVMAPMPFKVNITSRGPAFTKVINETYFEARSRMRDATIDLNNINLMDM